MSLTAHESFAIRILHADDLPAIKAVIEATDMFPSELLDDMTAPFLSGSSQAEQWFVTTADEPIAVAYVAPERMTEGTANLLLIAVDPRRHGQGLGAALLAHVELVRAAAGDRLLLVETSGLPTFARTRSFYLHNGYEEEARIRDYYQAGEDKVVFRKPLAG